MNVEVKAFKKRKFTRKLPNGDQNKQHKLSLLSVHSKGHILSPWALSACSKWIFLALHNAMSWFGCTTGHISHNMGYFGCNKSCV